MSDENEALVPAVAVEPPAPPEPPAPVELPAPPEVTLEDVEALAVEVEATVTRVEALASQLDDQPDRAPDGSPLLHQRGPGRTRRGILCMPSTHNTPPPGVARAADWTKGNEPWKGAISQNIGLVNCPACLAVRDGRSGGEGAAGPVEAAEKPKAAAEERPSIKASPDELAELVASLVVGGLFLISQGEARLVKADTDLTKGVTGLHSPFLPPAEGTAAYPAFKAWSSYLRKLIVQAGGELPAWVACVVATIPMVGAVAMLRGTKAEAVA